VRQLSKYTYSDEELLYDAKVQEIKDQLTYGTFRRVDPGEAVRFALPSKIFAKPKFGPRGELLKYKGRWVIGGHRQRPPEMDTASPSVRFETIMYMLNLALNDGLQIRTADVGCAFLETTLSEDVYTAMDKTSAKILCGLDDSYIKDLAPDGTITVKLLAAVYGLRQGSAEFYNHVAGLLAPHGFLASKADRALFIKQLPDGSKVFALVYVDDFLLMGTGEALDGVQKLLTSEFKKMTFSEPGATSLSYLGMHIEINEDCIELTQPGYVARILEKLGLENGTAATPYTAMLQKDEPSSELLADHDRELFRSTTMMLNFAATRTRPDIKLSTSWLSSKMQEPNQMDKSKLIRTLAYLNGCRERGLVLRKGPMEITASADASHATHRRGKAQLGGWIHLNAPGGAGIATISRKGTTVSPSSTYSETQALYETVVDVFWFRILAAETGHVQESPSIVDQDNTSTIRIMTRGPGWGGRSKMLELKYWWVTEQIENARIKLQWVRSEELTSDGFTKPVDVKDFPAWADLILGKPQL
jgi:hypothetical protein